MAVADRDRGRRASGPAWRVGAALPWIRTNLFSSPVNTAITLVYVGLLALLVPPFLDWAFFDATFLGRNRADCTGGGACWPFVNVWFEQIVFGRYPVAERWRLALVGAVLVLIVVALVIGRGAMRVYAAIGLAVAFPVLTAILVRGGSLGLASVNSSMLGGLALNVLLAVTAGSLSLPFGILLALARRSEVPALRYAATVFIEFWRGIPLITVLFTALILLPLFLPASWTLDALLRAYVALTVVYSAYIAEVVRGGLQAIPPGQIEAAASLGLGYWRTQAFVVLPQALRHVLPAIINTFIEVFKDSTLVYIIGLFDVLGVLSIALRDLEWVGLSAEAYLIVALIYFVCCEALSLYGRHLERQGPGASDAKRD